MRLCGVRLFPAVGTCDLSRPAVPAPGASAHFRSHADTLIPAAAAAFSNRRSSAVENRVVIRRVRSGSGALFATTFFFDCNAVRFVNGAASFFTGAAVFTERTVLASISRNSGCFCFAGLAATADFVCGVRTAGSAVAVAAAAALSARIRSAPGADFAGTFFFPVALLRLAGAGVTASPAVVPRSTTAVFE